MEPQWIASVGIDIGTSTTKMIVSRLKLVRTSGALSLPRYDIAQRELIYASPIYSTPLLGEEEVDAERIWAILAEEYERAGVRPEELKSGAVIITGETATKANARRIVHLLAERSGDFVVATAGADLEGLLAGKGAGADRRSLEVRGAVANIDIGGGTANAAVFYRGKAVGTVTYHIGGRLIELNAGGTVTSVSPSIRPWLEAAGYRLEPGHTVSYALLEDLCRAMSLAMLDDLAGMTAPEERDAVRKLTLGAPLPQVPPIEEWTISGGIGRLMEEAKPQSLAEAARHGDIGPLLAHTLKACAARYPIRLAVPAQTVRATVIGAGMQSTEISGATVHLDPSLLPIRNLPVCKLELSLSLLEQPASLAAVVGQTMQSGAALFERDASPPFALAVAGLEHCGYASLQRLADRLSESFAAYFPDSRVMVVVCDTDIAKALGQSLEKRLKERTKVVCIDQIKVEHGDYIDLGEPIAGIMIPVVVKTLAFHGREGDRR